MPESMSDDGTASRLPWLPSESHAKSDGGGPTDSTTSSIVRLISASATTEIIGADLRRRQLELVQARRAWG